MTKKTESATYKDMMGKVEILVREVSSPDIDLDDMVSRVEEGYKLIKQLRERLDTTKKKVEDLRSEFETQS